jgi:iron complex outermembrane receptor protein
MKSTYRNRLLTTTLFVSASVLGTPAFAQDVQEPVVGEPAQAVDETAPAPAPAEDAGREIVVTGSRIARPNLTSNSPIAVVTGEQVVEQGDITLETYLNTLPQANPAGTTTSNNPGNGGAANIDLRGLGSNRNIVLIDGRRPMVSDALQRVDLNTIPQGLIERIEVITGGAGAAYGADAIAGVVNIITKDDFEGVDMRASYANTTKHFDAREYQVSGLIGANFDDNRGNVSVSAEFSSREALIKAEREFAQQATSTTGTFPTGRINNVVGNPIPQSAIDALFLGVYGVDAVDVPTTGLLGFNSDDTLFGIGTFNNPRDVANFHYDPLGLDGAAANQNFFPDFYSYNFDIVNMLVLPLKRKSVFMRGNYEIDPHAEVFVRGGYTEYQSSTALAPTPVGVNIRCPGENSAIQASSPLIECGLPTPANFTGFVVPVTNPFIGADLQALLNARVGDDPRLVGAGAAEAFNIGYRFLGTGLREQQFDNRVLQGLVGLRGDITENWRYETYVSWGRTVIDTAATGNVNVQRVQELLEDPDGGVDICAGGFNPFGIQPFSQECVDFVDETGNTSTEFTQRIVQGFVTGKLAELPAGDVSIVLGAEHRKFNFAFDPGALFGPIAGFNTAVPAGGSNTFTDYFGELLIPILKDQPWAEELEINLTARHSKAEFTDDFAAAGDPNTGGSSDWSYGGTVSYAPVDWLRFRASYQRAVRAPNFSELFAGGGSFPQIFDPCSITSNFRTTGGAAATNVCANTGLGGLVNSFVATPGGQAFITFTGNTDLSPEKADTFTLGAVLNRWGFSGSLDFYRIKLSDVIFFPTVNMVIAACYGFHGINPDLDPNSPYCTSLFRSGGNIAAVFADEEIGGDPATGYFQYINRGTVKTSGIDFQLGYNLPTDFIAPASKLNLNLLVNYLITFKQEELPGVTLDYADTVSYFGAGLGTSFPRWKGNLNAAWSMDPFTLSTRIRYINGMKNRAAVQFPGEEANFSGTPSVWYFDFAGEVNIKNYTLRIGVNNAFDKTPPTYAPNVQSGTEPSLYDVIGRRAYVQARLRF